MSDLSYTIAFVSNRFDHARDLSQEPRGACKEYGRDVAEHLRDGLHQQGLGSEVVGESWGWQVRGNLESGAVLTIDVFFMGDDDEANDPDLWELAVRAYRRVRRLLFFTRRVDVPLPPEALDALRKTLVAGGAKILRCEPTAESRAP